MKVSSKAQAQKIRQLVSEGKLSPAVLANLDDKGLPMRAEKKGKKKIGKAKIARVLK
jgi:hypothetical protein